jgi:prephenate dehydratase
VVAAVAAGEAELGVLPLSNNAAGETGADDLLAQAGMCLVGEHELPIRMHLLGMAGSRLSDIRMIVSHPIALRQCAGQILALGLATEEASTTTAAAAQLNDPSRGVLASETAGRIYGLALLKRDMHDRSDNATRFAVFRQAAG